MLTFGQIKNGVCKRIASACPDSSTFREQVNAAIRQLMNRGSWWTTVQPVRMCICSCGVTWPRFVESVLAVESCGNSLPVANRWYDFQIFDDHNSCWARNLRSRCGGDGMGTTVVSDGTCCVVNQPSVPQFAQFYVMQPSDYGKTITIYGTDQNGQTIITDWPNGVRQEGMQLVFSKPFVQSPILIGKVSRIIKDKTLASVTGYWLDSSGNLHVLGTYQATETHPEYVHTKFEGLRLARKNGCACPVHISAMVKMKFIPVFGDNDVAGIDNEDAIRDMLLSIREKESGNIAVSRAYEQSAFRELNYQLKQRFPDEQMFVNFKPFGNDSLNGWRIRIGQI